MEHLSSPKADQVDPAVEVDRVDPLAPTGQVGPEVEAVEARPSEGKTVDCKQQVVMYPQSTERMV